eukprot:6176293-Pleurochrysis_carterae.AAC.2
MKEKHTRWRLRSSYKQSARRSLPCGSGPYPAAQPASTIHAGRCERIPNNQQTKGVTTYRFTMKENLRKRKNSSNVKVSKD